MDLRARLVILVVLALGAACARGGEGGVTAIGPTGGTVRSVDGLFELQIPAGALNEVVELSVRTRVDVLVPQRASEVYEVEPAGVVLALPATASLRSIRTSWVGRRALVTVDDDLIQEVPAGVLGAYHRQTLTARGVVEGLERRLFVLLERPEDGDCAGVSCGTPCGGCRPADPGCMPEAEGPRCSRDGACVPAEPLCPAQDWQTPLGRGRAFVVSQLSVADAQRGFDLDGRCRVAGECVDNDLAGFAYFVNDQLRQALLGGMVRMVVEVGGLDYASTDPSVTVSWLPVRDADEPFFPANDFSILAGDSRCCEFRPWTEALASDGRAPGRLVGALADGVLTARAADGYGPPMTLMELIDLFSDDPSDDELPRPQRLRLVRAQLTATLSDDGASIEDGLLGGVIVARDLASALVPRCPPPGLLCPPVGSFGDSWLDAIIDVAGQPTLDLDGDGLETFTYGPDGRLMACRDGDGREIPPMQPEVPASCADSPQVADGYGIAYTFSGVRATLRTAAP